MNGGYPSDWDERRRKTLERDEYRCQECGQLGGQEGDAQLNVHHIIPKSEGGNHYLHNLKTLCRSCHYDRHEHLGGGLGGRGTVDLDGKADANSISSIISNEYSSADSDSSAGGGSDRQDTTESYSVSSGEQSSKQPKTDGYQSTPINDDSVDERSSVDDFSHRTAYTSSSVERESFASRSTSLDAEDTYSPPNVTSHYIQDTLHDTPSYAVDPTPYIEQSPVLSDYPSPSNQKKSPTNTSTSSNANTTSSGIKSIEHRVGYLFASAVSYMLFGLNFAILFAVSFFIIQISRRLLILSDRDSIVILFGMVWVLSALATPLLSLIHFSLQAAIYFVASGILFMIYDVSVSISAD